MKTKNQIIIDYPLSEAMEYLDTENGGVQSAKSGKYGIDLTYGCTCLISNNSDFKNTIVPCKKHYDYAKTIEICPKRVVYKIASRQHLPGT